MTRELNDEQWVFLDILIRAKQKGVARVSRAEILNTPKLPDAVKIRVVFNALLIANGELVTLHPSDEFEVTEAGIRAFNAKFGKGEAAANPTAVADSIIALPDHSDRRVQ